MVDSLEERLSVLVIGPSQNGKSTFINRLIGLSRTGTAKAVEGKGHFKQTTTCTYYDIDMPLGGYIIVDPLTGMEVEVPDISDEETVIGKQWYKSFKKEARAKGMLVRARLYETAPILKLRLIDTPGLDDSEGKDFENMADVLSHLKTFSESTHKWETQISALAFVYNAKNAFSHSFKELVRYYNRCMPNLFGNLLVINSHFDIEELFAKRRHLIRDKFLGSSQNAYSYILKDRTKEFARILNDGRRPVQFHIDSKPNSMRDCYQELISCNTTSQILNFWVGCKPMEITQMRLLKNENMQAIDKELQRYLFKALNTWELERTSTLKHAKGDEINRSLLLEELGQVKNEISRIESELSRHDNDSEFPINTYYTSSDANGFELSLSWVIRRSITGSLVIKEDGFQEFQVRTEDAASGKWTSTNFNHISKSWNGTYELSPGNCPRLIARSYTTNGKKYSQQVSVWRKQLRRCQADQAERQGEWDLQYAGNVKGMNADLEKLVAWIAACQSLSTILEQPSPALVEGFNEASRERYSKHIGEITVKDLFKLVRVANPDLLDPLKRVLT